MKKSLSIILLITATLVSTTVKSQNNESETNFIGEINPSIQIYKGNNTRILDFDQGTMILSSEEINPENGKKETVISLIDFSFKQFGKISAKQKIFLSEFRADIFGKTQTYNLLNYKYKVIEFGNYLIFIDYENMKISSSVPNTGTKVDSFYYDRSYFRPTNQVFSNEKGEFIIQFVHPTDSNKIIYQIFNKQGEQINIVKKNKKFVPVCYYYRGLSRQNSYMETNPDCAFNFSPLHAFARKPVLHNERGGRLSKEFSENENTAYIHFYEGNYEDHFRDKSFTYTYNFNFEKGTVKDVEISLDFKYLIVNYQFIYLLPKIEITK